MAAMSAAAVHLPAAEEGDSSIRLFRQREGRDIIKLEQNANAILSQSPRDVCALMVKAHVLGRRARLAAALRLNRLAVVSARTGVRAPLESEPDWVTLALYELSETLRQMDRRQEQLQTLDEYFAAGGEGMEKRNQISYPARLRKVEALIKLGRISEAQSAIEDKLSTQGLSSAERHSWMLAKALGKSFEDPGSDEPLQILDQLLVAERNPDEGLLYARGVLLHRRQDFARARSDYLASLKARPSAESAAFAARQMMLLNLHSGSWDQTVEWASRSWGFLRAKAPAMRQDLDKSMRCSAGLACVTIGYPDLAVQILNDLPSDPPRLSGSMLDRSQWACASGVTRWLALQAANSLGAVPPSDSLWFKVRQIAVDKISASVSSKLLREQVLYHLAGVIAAPLPPMDALAFTGDDPLLFLTLVRMLGPSVGREILHQWPIRGPAADLTPLLEAEIAWRSGRADEAGQLAAKALDTLSSDQLVLRARAMIIRLHASGDLQWAALAWQAHPASYLLAGERIPIAATIPVEMKAELDGIIVAETRSDLKLSIELNGGSPQAEISMPGANPVRVKLDPNSPADAVKRLLLCPLLGGLSDVSTAGLQGHATLK
jgi:tetratricopeptide (TPR) repeat protein